MPSVHVFEMTIGRSDFRRLLPGALGVHGADGSDGPFVHAEADRSWRLELKPLPDLSFGPVRLERHLVQWTFSGYADAEVQGLLDRFERHFRRGGG